MAESVATAAKVASAAFEANGDEDEYGGDDLDAVAESVAGKVSLWQLENLIVIVNRAYEVKSKKGKLKADKPRTKGN